MKTDVLIIGAGQAGAMTAIALRQKKYKGSITIIGEEEHLPYQRPPLSKNFLTGITPKKSLYFKSSTYYEKNQIDILLNNNEKNYLFKYHLNIYSKYSKFLNRPERKWLASLI